VAEARTGAAPDFDAKLGIQQMAVIVRSVNFTVTLKTTKTGSLSVVGCHMGRRQAMALATETVIRLI